MSKDLFKTIISDFHLEELPLYFRREISIPLDSKKIITLIGPRRSGKTVALFNLMHTLLQQSVAKNHIIYINFEDERYDFSALDLDNIIIALLELYPGLRLQECYFFFDEIQNIDNWDRFVRRVYDTISKLIFLSGSNAKLLSREIATSLRGRTLTYQILPLSLREYCAFQDIKLDIQSTRNKATVLRQLNQYLYYGGFPEIVNYSDDLKIKTLQEYFNTMIYRDMIERFAIKNVTVLKYFLKRLFASATKSISIHKMYNELRSAGFKIAKEQLYTYLDIAENIFLVIILKKHTPTLINQELGEKKIYIIDNGLLNAITYNFSNNIGKNMEQIVLQELIRREEVVFFYKDKFECDFIIQRGLKIISVIQVCYELENMDTLEREIKGLVEACRAFNLTRGMIITSEKRDSMHVDQIDIEFIPLYQWLFDKTEIL